MNEENMTVAPPEDSREDVEVRERAEVFGDAFEEAEHEMRLLTEQMRQQAGVPHASKEACDKWAEEHHINLFAFSTSAKKFFRVSHKGELMGEKDFETYYDSMVRVMSGGTGNGRANQSTWPWWASAGFEEYNRARIVGEISDGVHDPLYYRDYVRPTGYYNRVLGRFNMARPFNFFARRTGRDTSHIYALIEHVGGECAMWLLAWLRAKMVHPTVKTQVVPIIVSRTQGSGKSTFGEVICKGLFGKDNVLVTDQYDSQSRFNADYADALVVCMEEKEETDKRNPVAAIKSRATATMIRKEQKGVDPIYQESYTDFLMTTNKDVPIKFEGREDQRRFMIMEADETFTRKTSALADEVFSKLYGYNADGERVGVPFVDDRELVEQFKYELYTRDDIRNIPLRSFPKTAAYNRCYTLPRTSENAEIESVVRALAPFIKATLERAELVRTLPEAGELASIVQYPGAVEYVPEGARGAPLVALCRPLVFYDLQTNKPYAHAVVERGLLDCALWLREDFNLDLLPETDPLVGGFREVSGRYRAAATARFSLCAPKQLVVEGENAQAVKKSTLYKPEFAAVVPITSTAESERRGERLRVDENFRPSPQGCFETVNELRYGTRTLHGKTQNVEYMDTFLFESDDCDAVQFQVEKKRAEEWKKGTSEPIGSLVLYKERLDVQKAEALRLFKERIACRIVYSGAKSYHMLVRVKDAPRTTEEYSWLHAYLCTILSDKIVYDTSTSDPARLTRSPVEYLRRTFNVKYGIEVVGYQQLICSDFSHVYDFRWRDLYKQWLERPLLPYEKKGRRLVPSKPEYREAMEALLKGTYWTDETWDGRRQTTFFPAYRLLRSLGYSHDELWTDEVIFQNLDMYAKQGEIAYWRSREASELVCKIDRDFDEAEEAGERGA